MASEVTENKKPVRQLTSHYSNTSLFSKEAKIKFNGLALAFQNQTDLREENQDVTSNPETGKPVRQLTVSDVMFCNCCQVYFSDREEQLIHYKCDWHRYNLHLRLKGLGCVSEEEFELVSGDVSSISGSEEDSGNETVDLNLKLPVPDGDVSSIEEPEDSFKDRRFNKIFFKNEEGELLSLYKCLLFHKKNPVKSSSDLVKEASKLIDHPNWAVLMVTSGHFAGAIFNGGEVLDHKTFHRYTVRAKRGSAQSSRDGQGNAPKSAGASLRRYNEAALNQEVQELLTSWQTRLESCSLIFVRIPVANRAMFYGGKNPALKKDDLRIRIIPFPTRRPTFNELKRVQKMLSCIECFGQEVDVTDFIPLSPQRFYSKDTDQLEIRPSIQITKPKPNPSEESFIREEGKDTIAEEEFEEKSEEEELEPLGPGNPLKEFEIYVEKKRRKRKPKSGKSKASNTKENEKNGEGEAERLLMNSLFTACKTGNVESLQKAIDDLHEFLSVKFHSENVDYDNHVPNHTGICGNGKESQESKPDQDSKASVETSDAATGNEHQSIDQKKVAEFLNYTTGDSASTLLHHASQCNHHNMIPILLQKGADPSIKDKNGKLPYILGNTEVKNAFRRFMALYPAKYDYIQAQIPSPLTPEMEASKKQKNAERRTAKKKSMHERNKVKKAEELRQKEENDEKDRFLNLSDREKRALAAERRILQQHNEQEKPKPVLSRCFQCGVDTTGQVPFEYSNFKFCTTKCLREHRAKSK